ncbi:MAG: helix-turn-helix domain-containing protein [Thermobispora bispora]|uniref:transcriptional regulator n=1 Tax=Thermobispora bispora TaxID=2006 RepID=UPI00197E490A|nr:helix-turn-helix transcriptional regulator [Thermobispora bispora]MBO2475079.1 hypothetical protein [Actinomycetales bacterium]MBX6167894.1 helix-turn-helix domain-containing protein [Thermobispora bispora]QSI46909.1 transcriptional regulator [Thermobispora bispora]
MARSGRRDQPIDRRLGPIAEFVDDLRRLRGDRSLEAIGSRMGYHPSTISRRLNPKELPPWDFVERYVKACGADPGPWRARWRDIQEADTARPAPAERRDAAGEPPAEQARHVAGAAEQATGSQASTGTAPGQDHRSTGETTEHDQRGPGEAVGRTTGDDQKAAGHATGDRPVSGEAAQRPAEGRPDAAGAAEPATRPYAAGNAPNSPERPPYAAVPAEHAAGQAPSGPDGAAGSPTPPGSGRRRIGFPVTIAAVAVVSIGLALYFTFTPDDEEPPRTLTASPTSAPSEPPAGHGFTMRIERMAFRLFSREWTMTAPGDIELWSNNQCPQGTAHYWVALRPNGEPVQFACNSWQYHKWIGVPAGTYHLETWKDHDGNAIHGSGVLRSSVPIVVHPKVTPAQTASASPDADAPAAPGAEDERSPAP